MKIVFSLFPLGEGDEKNRNNKQILLHADCHFIVLLIYLKESLNYVSVCGEGWCIFITVLGRAVYYTSINRPLFCLSAPFSLTRLILPFKCDSH